MSPAGPPDVRCFSVGPIQENAYIVRAGGVGSESTAAVMVDPGEESARLLDAASALGVQIEAILITHCHFDHVGAVAPVARATGAPVYCPKLETAVLADIMKWTMPGFGPFESWRAERTVSGGERLTLAGLQIEVVFTPGHSPGHVTYAIAQAGPRTGEGAQAGRERSERAEGAQAAAAGTEAPRGEGAQVGQERPEPAKGEQAGTAGTEAPRGEQTSVADPPAVLLSGDVLFQGSVGRVDLPGGDWGTLERSIGELMRAFPRDTAVYPGHMGATTLGREWDTNPFLAELRAATTA